MRTLDCGHTDENYVWPSENLEEVCYDCFSAEADDAWWAMMVGLSELVLLADYLTEEGDDGTS